MRFLIVAALALGFSGCGYTYIGKPQANHVPTLHLTFQGGQSAEVSVIPNSPFKDALMGWADAGVYNGTPVYRNMPGVFLLTGKPRLAGNNFVQGVPMPTPAHDVSNLPGRAEAGLVVHADGTVGPELIVRYGTCILSACERPQAVRFGYVTRTTGNLKDILRGDRLESVTVE
jgi:hypothetical protein